MPGKLYICPTPIGNLEDMTLRALRVLKEVDLIIAEDTRRSRKLLEHYQITTPFSKSYYQGVEKERAGEIVEMLASGKSIALISDAGTPLIADPGYPLIKQAIECGIAIIVLPGPTALVTALVASGIPANNFIFDGALPRKEKKRREYLESIKLERRTIVLYESPHRIMETLEIMTEILGERGMALCRELSKKHEAILRGRPKEILGTLSEGPVKGEIVLIISGATDEEIREEKQREHWDVSIEEQVEDLIATGLDKMEAIKKVARSRGLSKQEVYDRLLKLRGRC